MNGSLVETHQSKANNRTAKDVSCERLKRNLDTFLEIDENQHVLQKYKILREEFDLFDRENVKDPATIATFRVLVQMYQRDYAEGYITKDQFNNLLSRVKRKFDYIVPVSERKDIFIRNLPRKSSPYDTHSLLFYCHGELSPKELFNLFFIDKLFENVCIRCLGSGYYSVTLDNIHDVRRSVSLLCKKHPLLLESEEDWTDNEDEDFTFWFEINQKNITNATDRIYMRLATLLDRIELYPCVLDTSTICSKVKEFVSYTCAGFTQRIKAKKLADESQRSKTIFKSSVFGSFCDVAICTVDAVARRISKSGGLTDDQILQLANIGLPKDWRAALDPTSKSVYYYNFRNQVTTWHRPQ
ncbi:histone-lysine N-methyltransferase [Acrasis kona]|uniref:Histone-lysine N-methyltransferase n=1 Tax=Acrasis kona TaxID=1008807 RepID=A0AAW2YVW0_9EUKA